MRYKFDTSLANFQQNFQNFLHHNRASEADIGHKVKTIIDDVKNEGDTALLKYSQRWDNIKVQTIAELKLSQEQLKVIAEDVTADQKNALELAFKRITDFHEKQRPNDYSSTDDKGVKLGWRWNAVDSVGLYVPGGSAAYPSSVLMNAIPAMVAGVSRIVVVTPPGQLNPLVAYALLLCDIQEVWSIGGAQAVAALAYGTKTIDPVDVITGPGNAFVAEAKKQVFGNVGIDMIAGPSEILVIADDSANPQWLAADLLSQAEHDALAQSILVTSSKELAEKVQMHVEQYLQTLERKDIAAKSWKDLGAIIICQDLKEACDISNQVAPEHLEIMTEDPEAYLALCKHAGSIFLGHFTPEAFGDYLAGPNHVLPTSRSARFSSGLGVLNFMKRSTYIKGNQHAAQALFGAVSTLADGEHLQAHAISADLRVKE